MNSRWVRRSTLKLNSHAPSRFWTKLEDGKKGLSKKTKLERDLEPACGSTQKPLLAVVEDMCRSVPGQQNEVDHRSSQPGVCRFSWVSELSSAFARNEVLEALNFDVDVPTLYKGAVVLGTEQPQQ